MVVKTLLGTRILVDLGDKPVEEITKSGIILSVPNSNTKKYEKRTEGVVVAVGVKALDKSVLGKKIRFEKYAGFSLTLQGREYQMMNEGDLQAVLPK